ncbi:hypothetical protein [Lysinibacillus sp. BPa_S21]|uniref:hypothetical protein n=1 Tax=Lysinibacillus sp. BPa_S21 TaxID=2932478 RepID=UPI002013526E|nr:hypothetical protein [Lysinibacillus sp. BPa_S21]MCL1696743.1 hypothetical protein [Lysinibacillus sp. BPa_S21]
MYDSYDYDDFDPDLLDPDFFDPGLLAFLLVLLLIGLVVSVIYYIIGALIYYNASKTNGFSDVAYISWIPIVNIYSFFLLTAKGEDDQTVRAAAKRNVIIYAVLTAVSFIPYLLVDIIATIAIIGFICYFTYRLFYRWTGGTGKAVLYTILTIITLGLFFNIYGLMKMKNPFVA